MDKIIWLTWSVIKLIWFWGSIIYGNLLKEKIFVLDLNDSELGNIRDLSIKFILEALTSSISPKFEPLKTEFLKLSSLKSCFLN